MQVILSPVFSPGRHTSSLWLDRTAPLDTQVRVAMMVVTGHQLGFTQCAFVFFSVKITLYLWKRIM